MQRKRKLSSILSAVVLILAAVLIFNAEGSASATGGDNGTIKTHNAGTPPTDVCPNIPGNQDQVPRGLVKDSAGNCVPETPPDLCPNIGGYQSALPPGYTLVKGKCVKQHVDTPKSPPSAQPVPETGA